MRENSTFEPAIQPSRPYEGFGEIPGGRDTGLKQSPLKEKARPMLSKRKGELAERIKDTAQVLRETGDTLIEREKARGGEYAHKAAEQLDRYSTYLQDNSVDRIINDVQTFGRERPWVTIGGAFLVGVAVARFFKSSERS
jgi:ElaB/YqjD/DUF883 family membrane-anchored ribosome-binding protein